MPAELVCLRCDGDDPDCPSCGGEGYFEVAGCPQDYVGREIAMMMDMVDQTEHGVWPIVGGVLDQSASFCAFRRFVRAEEARWRQELYGKDRS